MYILLCTNILWGLKHSWLCFFFLSFCALFFFASFICLVLVLFCFFFAATSSSSRGFFPPSSSLIPAIGLFEKIKAILPTCEQTMKQKRREEKNTEGIPANTKKPQKRMWLYINVSGKFGYRFYLDDFGLVWFGLFCFQFHFKVAYGEPKKIHSQLTKRETQMRLLRRFRYILISTKWILYFCLICWVHTHSSQPLPAQPFHISFSFTSSFSRTLSGFRISFFGSFFLTQRNCVRFFFISGSFSTHCHLYYSRINGFKHQLSGKVILLCLV